jgi:predicted transcriptional regulator
MNNMKKRIPRRDILKIYGDLLSVLRSEGKSDRIVLTRVQVRMNVPFDRLKHYIEGLRELGLIENQTSLELTEKGKQYLKEYEKIIDFMKRMGFTYEYRRSVQGENESAMLPG